MNTRFKFINFLSKIFKLLIECDTNIAREVWENPLHAHEVSSGLSFFTFYCVAIRKFIFFIPIPKTARS